MYIINLIKELIIWRKVKRIAKEHEEYLNENNFRVDWIGRIYTVVNIPDEHLDNEYVADAYVLKQLRNYDEVFLKIGISDVIIPEFRKIKDTNSYLLILSPDNIYFRFIPLIRFIFYCVILYFAGIFLYQIINDNWPYIVNFFQTILN